MPSYSVYGINLNSNLHIPGLIPLPNPSDRPHLSVLLGCMPRWVIEKQLLADQQEWYISPYQDEQGNPALRVWKVNQGKYFYFKYTDGTLFVIDQYGTEIWATWAADSTLEDTATYLLGPILGFVLRLKGVICLHASAIALQDRVALFVGDSGAGKSTTVAALAQRGHPVLSDDVVALVDRGNTFLVQPAYPRIRLWKESVATLYGTPDALPRIVPSNPTWDKQYLDLTQQEYCFQTAPLPIAAIYLLGDRRLDSTTPRIDPIPIQEQLVALLTNTYANRLLKKEMRSQEFDILSRLVKHIPVRRIVPHTDISRLPNLLDAVLDDFQGITSCFTSQIIANHS